MGVLRMDTLQYSNLCKACEAPITHSTVLNQLDAVESLADSLQDSCNKNLPSSLRPYVIAVRDIHQDESEAYLASWKSKLQSPLLNLTDDLAKCLYVLIYAMLFIQLFALNDYQDLFYKIYTRLISSFDLI